MSAEERPNAAYRSTFGWSQALRRGEAPGHGRHVLAIGSIIAIVAFTIVWLVSA